MSENNNFKLQKFEGKTILGIDYGKKFTGLSLYALGSHPFPLLFGRIKYASDEHLVSELKRILEDECVDVIVLGVPHFTDGTPSTMTKTVLSFKELLKKSVNIPVFEQDETLTTVEAEERMKNSPRFNFKVDMTQIDALCASIIVEEFLRSPIIDE